MSVIVFPFMKDPAQWHQYQRKFHQYILEVLPAEGIRYFDLMPALQQALAEGIDPQENPGDQLHPRQAAAELMAVHLMEEKLLDARCSIGN